MGAYTAFFKPKREQVDRQQQVLALNSRTG